jgi:hypothetical protein
LALAGIYRDFLDVAFEEYTSSLDYYDWSYYFEPALKEALMYQIAGKLDNWEINEDNTIEGVLMCLVENQRYAVYEILLKCFGNENLLFNSLWLATHVAEDQDNDEDQDNRNESANDPFWPLTSDRMAAYAWTSEGCCRRY